MKSFCLSLVAFTALAAGGLSLGSQPEEKKDKKGPPPAKKGWQPGKIMPPHIREDLELTDDQENQVRALEKEVRERLLQILTEDQKSKLDEIARRPPPPPPPPPGEGDDDGPPRKKGRPERKGRYERTGDGFYQSAREQDGPKGCQRHED